MNFRKVVFAVLLLFMLFSRHARAGSFAFSDTLDALHDAPSAAIRIFQNTERALGTFVLERDFSILHGETLAKKGFAFLSSQGEIL